MPQPPRDASSAPMYNASPEAEVVISTPPDM